MGPEYDLIVMLGDLILILLFFYLLAEMGLSMLEQLYTADARIIQEYASGYLSMSNFAPDSFIANQTFPKVSHSLSAMSAPPLVMVNVGSKASVGRNFLDQTYETLKDTNLVFVQKPPLPFTLAGEARVGGSCAGAAGFAGCIFSTSSYNAIEIAKKSAEITVNLLFK